MHLYLSALALLEEDWFQGTLTMVRIRRGECYQKDYEPETVYQREPETMLLLDLREGRRKGFQDESDNRWKGRLKGAEWEEDRD